MKERKIKIGLIGFGTVGVGVFKCLKEYDDIEVVQIAVKDKSKKRNVKFDKKLLTEDAFEIVNNSEIDIVVELIGGVKPAFDLIKTAIKNKKHIVTANKELLAKHGEELFKLAQKYNVVILYEAAVAGGIPIINPLKTILSGNKITKVEAILNGTTNYILSKMDKEKVSYEKVLKEAQELGYAETNPTGDVEGFDAAYKLTTLATLAFKKRVKLENVYTEGITHIRAEDMTAANDLGYKIKLIAMAQLDENNRADVRVHPMLISQKSPLAYVNGVTNAVNITGFPIGTITLSGAGAGEFPTSSSVMGDILSIINELDKTDYILPMMRCNHKENAVPIDISETKNKYYLSLNAKNNKGVIGNVGNICAEFDISVESIVQKNVSEDNSADITVITELCLEKNMQGAVKTFKNNDFINRVNSLIRVQTCTIKD